MEVLFHIYVSLRVQDFKAFMLSIKQWNMQKRMEKEMGTKIAIKEGRMGQKRDLMPNPAENEGFHVLVEADTQEGLYAAVGMVQMSLPPMDKVLNENKRQQLRKLAVLNGEIMEDEFYRLCGEAGQR